MAKHKEEREREREKGREEGDAINKVVRKRQ